jgi:hypothetical protein
MASPRVGKNLFWNGAYHAHLCFSMGLKGLVNCFFGLMELFCGFSLRLAFVGVSDVGREVLVSSWFDVEQIRNGMDGYGR